MPPGAPLPWPTPDGPQGQITIPALASRTAETQPATPAATPSTAPGDGRVAPEAAGRRIPLGDAPVRIGRAPDNTVTLPDVDIAPYHARIERTANGQYEVTDLASNGAIFVNSIPIRTATLLPGAELRIGQRRFIFTGDALLAYDASHEARVDALDLTETRHVGGLGILGGHEKVLLDDISITLLPGTFVAIVGASGAGKTTLLRALSGQDPADSGKVLYNGVEAVERRHAFSTKAGFVPQDDIVHKNLTVQRALYYAGRLRLPETTTRAEVRERVRQALEAVDLTDQRRQLIGKLSGGQRKRVNIALELLAKPTIFYLDEPTSGLDPGLDRMMMELLRRLANGGQTVALVTHATSNIDICDYICFLAPNGRLAYYGPPERLKQFFQVEDYADIYNALYSDADRWIALFRQSPDYLQYVEALRLQGENIARAEALSGASSADADGIGAHIPVAHANGAHGATPHGAGARVGVANATRPHEATAGTNRLRQFAILTQRYLDLMAHDPINVVILLAQAPIIALLITLLADQNIVHQVMAPPHPYTHADYSAQRTLFIMVCSAVWFGIVNAAREIVKEGPVYRRERSVSLHLWPYIFSKLVVLGILCAIQDAALLLIVGSKVGYPTHGLLWPGWGGAFAEMYITLLLVALVGLTLGLLISALAPTTDRAMSLVPLALIPQIIFANVIFTLSGSLGKIISYLIPARWGMQAIGSIVRLNDAYTGMGNVAFYDANRWHLVGFWAMLVAIGVVFLGLTYLFQRRKDLGA